MHIFTLTFDDGFAKAFRRIAEIHEKRGLSASLNIIATGHRPNFAPPGVEPSGIEFGGFDLWNELKARGHEIMPHGYLHANKAALPFEQGRSLILKCLDVFDRELHGFDRKQAVFSFPYNGTTPELEAWVPTQVRAFRGGHAEHGLNPLPTRNTVAIRTTGFGPGTCDDHLEQCVNHFLAQPEGWLVYCTHSLDGESWGPIGSAYLEQLLDRLLAIPTVRIMTMGAALKTVD